MLGGAFALKKAENEVNDLLSNEDEKRAVRKAEGIGRSMVCVLAHQRTTENAIIAVHSPHTCAHSLPLCALVFHGANRKRKMTESEANTQRKGIHPRLHVPTHTTCTHTHTHVDWRSFENAQDTTRTTASGHAAQVWPGYTVFFFIFIISTTGWQAWAVQP